MKRVCPACHRIAPRVKPGAGFVCRCFEPNLGSRNERKHLERISSKYRLTAEQAKRLAELVKRDARLAELKRKSK